MSLLHTAPLLGIGIVLLAVMFLAVELGYRGHRWLDRDEPHAGRQSGHDHLLQAVLGLLALLLGFTFSLALDRFEVRRDLVTQEANAISTTWLRAQILQEPNRSSMSGLLRRYLDARLAWSEGDQSLELQGRTAAIQDELWTAVGKAIRTDPSGELSQDVMGAMNTSFMAATSRAVARSTDIPDQVLAILYLYAVLSMVLLGYILGAAGKPHRIATALLLVLLTLALVVILDLDRPLDGSIQVSNQPLYDLKASLH
jgi:hypothetical protein